MELKSILYNCDFVSSLRRYRQQTDGRTTDARFSFRW